MKSMYQISSEALNIASALEDGELSPELELSLRINQTELQEKGINYAYVIKESEETIECIDKEIKRLQEAKKVQSNKVERLKETLVNAMNIYGIEKIESALIKISIRKSESVEISEGLPLKYQTVKTVYTPDKTRIKNAIKSGENVLGATLQTNYNLQIK
jgi:hypothetical protein